MKKEISSDQNGKEAFCEYAFCYVYSSNIDEAFFTLHSLETPSWMDPRRDIWDHMQAYGEIGNIVREKLERSLVRNYLVMCAFLSGLYNFLLISHSLNTVSVKPKE